MKLFDQFFNMVSTDVSIFVAGTTQNLLRMYTFSEEFCK